MKYYYWIGIYYEIGKIKSFCGCPLNTKLPIDTKEKVLMIAESIRRHHNYKWVSVLTINLLRKGRS